MLSQVDRLLVACHGCQSSIDSPLGSGNHPWMIVFYRRNGWGQAVRRTTMMVDLDEVYCCELQEIVRRYGICHNFQRNEIAGSAGQ